MTYGEAIRQGRETLCWTQEQLAESLGISRQAVSKWEANLSRPARTKLKRLSEVLNIPPEVWDAIDAEQAAADQPPDKSRIWKITAGFLAAACIALGILLAALISGKSITADVRPEGLSNMPDDLSRLFPETLPLTVRHDFDFGDIPAGEYDPAAVPFLNNSSELQKQEIWGGCLGDESGAHLPALRLSVVSANPVQENHTTFYDVYLLYALPDSAGNLNWTILTRLADYNHYVNFGCFSAEKFTNVLGHDGFKLSITAGASAGDMNYYIIQRPDGSPALMAVGNRAQEFDVDEDGVLEIISIDGNPWLCEITDTQEGEEGAFVYTLYPYGDGFSNVGIGFEPEKGGFVVTDSQDAVMARYILRDGEMQRLPLTDFTAMDYPDVTGTALTFITEGADILSDGRKPDEVLYNGVSRITHRQQAYLALQELYDLTGLKVDACYCAANEGGVRFSLLPDGFLQQSFFTADFPEAYGGRNPIPQFHIAWKELENDWSPLSFEDAARPESGAAEENTLRWYYNRLKIFHAGEIAIETDGALSEERYLYLENGDQFIGRFESTRLGPALVDLMELYPGGEDHQ